MLYLKSPTYLDLKTFGCLSFASTPDVNRNKLDPRARKCVFIGFKNEIKGYILLDLKSREIFIISRNALFYETIFPCSSTENTITERNDHMTQDLSFLNDSRLISGRTMLYLIILLEKFRIMLKALQMLKKIGQLTTPIHNRLNLNRLSVNLSMIRTIKTIQPTNRVTQRIVFRI